VADLVGEADDAAGVGVFVIAGTVVISGAVVTGGGAVVTVHAAAKMPSDSVERTRICRRRIVLSTAAPDRGPYRQAEIGALRASALTR
jgi:hypothetical protein